MHPVSVGLYDERHFLRSFMFDVLSRQPGIKICFKAWSEPFLFDALAGVAPRVLMMNLGMKVNASITLVKKIKEHFPGLHIAAFVYGNALSQQEVFRVINAGAACILSDTHSPEEVIRTLESLAEKGFHVNEVVSEAMFSFCKRSSALRKSFGPDDKFNDREIKIIEGKRSGKTSLQMADELCLSKKTVDGLLRDMYARHGCRNFYELLGKYALLT